MSERKRPWLLSSEYKRLCKRLRDHDELKAEEEAEEAEALEWQRLREKDPGAAFSAFPRKKLHRLQRLAAYYQFGTPSDAEAAEAEEEARVQNDLEAKLVATEVKAAMKRAALASEAEAESEAEAGARA